MGISSGTVTPDESLSRETSPIPEAFNDNSHDGIVQQVQQPQQHTTSTTLLHSLPQVPKFPQQAGDFARFSQSAPGSPQGSISLVCRIRKALVTIMAQICSYVACLQFHVIVAVDCLLHS